MDLNNLHKNPYINFNYELPKLHTQFIFVNSILNTIVFKIYV